MTLRGHTNTIAGLYHNPDFNNFRPKIN